jgi:hypothetical protein
MREPKLGFDSIAPFESFRIKSLNFLPFAGFSFNAISPNFPCAALFISPAFFVMAPAMAAFRSLCIPVA